MYKKNLLLAVLLIFIVGLFFQANRVNALLHLFKDKNTSTELAAPMSEPTEAQAIKKDRFLIVYDDQDVYSTFLKHKVQDQLETYMKKKADVITVRNTDSFNADEGYSAVLWATTYFDNEALWNEAKQYATNGGTLEVLMAGGLEDTPSVHEFLGIQNINGSTTTTGIDVSSNLLLGAKGFKMGKSDDISYGTYALDCELDPSANVYLRSSAEELPLAWEKDQGAGKVIVYNGTEIYTKRNSGILTALLSQSHSDFIFPVCATKTEFIDDFPSPVPDGDFSKIYDEYGMTTNEFYERIWWPYMLKTAKNFDLKYTGLVIETYNDRTSGDFYVNDDVARRDFIKYGRELLNSGGELGIHGYNHQALVGEGYGVKEFLGYEEWPNQADMEDSLRELKRYIEDAFPGYQIHVYVPPSNVLSPEGKAAIKNVFPTLEAYSSLYSGGDEAEKAYIQDFKRNDNGTYDFPRITSGYDPNDDMYFDMINGVNTFGIFSHFVHPDELFYEEEINNTFGSMEKTFTQYVKYVKEHYPWLRSETLSDTLPYFSDYLDMDYRYTQTGNTLSIYTWNYEHEPSYILRSVKNVKHFEGCEVTKIQDDAYYIKIKNSKATIVFDGE